MALEELITKLISSLDANTAALKGSKAAAPAAVSTTADKKPAATDKKAATVDFDLVKAAAKKVMDKHGKPFAKKMIADVGGGAKELAVVKPEKYAALLKAFEASLDEDDAASEPAEDDDEL